LFTSFASYVEVGSEWRRGLRHIATVRLRRRNEGWTLSSGINDIFGAAYWQSELALISDTSCVVVGEV
jgi:hypothetical protein